jgi:GT2 family glycosyltransferase
MCVVDIDLVVVNYKTYDMIQTFIDRFYRFRPSTPNRLILIDNASDESKLSKVNTHDAIVVAFEENVGYARACNYGAAMGNSKYIALLNSDIEFINNTCIDQCVQFLENNPDVGVVGPFQVNSAGAGRRVTNAGIFGTGDKPKHRGWMELDRNQYRENCEALMVMGSALIVRRAAWETIAEDPIFRKHWPYALGAMPEHTLYYEDTALCYAMPKFGYKVFYLGEPGVEVVHRYHKTIGAFPEGDDFSRSQKQFRALMDDWGIVHD